MSLFESNIVLIQEMTLNKEEGEKLRRKLGFWKIELVGTSRGIGILWDPRRVEFNPLISRSNWMGGKLKALKEKLNLF